MNDRRFEYSQAIENELQKGNKHNKRSIEKLAEQYGIFNKNLVKEMTELAIVRIARSIAGDKTLSDQDKYHQIVELYQNQVNLSHRTSQSMMFQQYSTPAPISFTASLFVSKTDTLGSVKRGGRFTKNHFAIHPDRTHIKNEQTPLYFEPSAGNGLLTIALPYNQTIVNELDDVRLENLQSQPFKKVLNQDATLPFVDYYKHFDGVITNPPFGSLMDPVVYDTYPMKKLDFLMTLRALDTMKDNGRAAIIVGGHTEYDEVGRVQAGQNRIFYNYLYSHYQVDDIINIDGHKLYSRQGTAFNVRLILINGRKKQIEGVAPLKNSLLSEVVSDFERLWERVFGSFDTNNESDVDKRQRMKLKRMRMLEMDLLNGYVQTEVLTVKSLYSTRVDLLKLKEFYKQNLLNKVVLNRDKNIHIVFKNFGLKKSIYGRKDKNEKVIKIDRYIATAIHYLQKLLEYACFEFYGYNLKPNHKKIGGVKFWNFRSKLKIDNKVYYFSLPVLEIKNKDYLQYSIEYAKIKKSLVVLRAKSVKKQRPKHKRFS